MGRFKNIFVLVFRELKEFSPHGKNFEYVSAKPKKSQLLPKKLKLDG
jgi:hypothetical protein